MWKEKLYKLNFWALCLLSCFPVLNMKVTVGLIITFTVICIVSGFVSGIKNISRIRIREALLLLSVFLLIFLRTYITDRSKESLFYLEVSLSLLVFPLAFFISPVNYSQRQKNILSMLFSFSTLAIVCYGQFKAASRLSDFWGPGKFWPTLSDVFRDPSFPYHFRTLFEQHTHIHPTYACVFLGISLLLILDRFLKSYYVLSVPAKVLYVISMILFLMLQALLASRTPFLATILCTMVLIFVSLRKKIYALYLVGGAVLLTLVLMWMIPSISSRFREISFSNINAPSESNENSFNIRFGIYQCSTGIISEHWLWGIGPGNIQEALNTCYSGISKAVYDQKNYNTHNQFLDYWAGLGIAGPLLLLLILIYNSYRNVKTNNPVAMGISLLFLIAMLTENMLTRQNGIVPFAYFTSLYFYTRNSPPKPIQ